MLKKIFFDLLVGAFMSSLPLAGLLAYCYR
jgi:hypothetical protein